MNNLMIAPIQLDRLFLVKSSFQLEESTAENMEQKISLDFTVKRLESENSEGLVDLYLNVETSLVDSDNDDEEKLFASAEVYVSAHASLAADTTEQVAKEYLLSNAISLAYGHAKTCIMTLTGLSPAGPVIVPAIMPFSIARDYLAGDSCAAGE